MNLAIRAIITKEDSTVPKELFVFAEINARMMPMERGDRYEDPLHEALEEKNLGEVSGAGTSLFDNGEIESAGLDIQLTDSERGLPFVQEFLIKCGAPKGSKLVYEHDGQSVEVPFGLLEGLAIYLNGTDLPDHVYAECDVNEVVEEINRLLGDQGSIQGHWQGPTETALYLYGNSAADMKSLIHAYLESYPLCRGARVVQVA